MPQRDSRGRFIKGSKNAPVPDFEAMADAVMNGLAREVAKHAKHFFLQGFDKGGFTDINFIPWVKRQDLESRKILVQSETLKNGIDIISEIPERIEIGVDPAIPYAEIHNAGGTIRLNITEKMRRYFWAMYYETKVDRWKWMALNKNTTMVVNIPERKFIGQSYILNQQIDKIIVNRIAKSIPKP